MQSNPYNNFVTQFGREVDYKVAKTVSDFKESSGEFMMNNAHPAIDGLSTGCMVAGVCCVAVSPVTGGSTIEPGIALFGVGSIGSTLADATYVAGAQLNPDAADPEKLANSLTNLAISAATGAAGAVAGQGDNFVKIVVDATGNIISVTINNANNDDTNNEDEEDIDQKEAGSQ